MLFNAEETHGWGDSGAGDQGLKFLGTLLDVPLERAVISWNIQNNTFPVRHRVKEGCGGGKPQAGEPRYDVLFRFSPLYNSQNPLSFHILSGGRGTDQLEEKSRGKEVKSPNRSDVHLPQVNVRDSSEGSHSQSVVSENLLILLQVVLLQELSENLQFKKKRRVIF